MPEVPVQRHRTPSFWFVIALALAIPVGMFAQGGQGGGGGRGGGGRGAAPAGAPAAGAPAVPGAPPAAGGAAAALPAQGRGGAAGGGAGARGTSPVDLTGTWVSEVTEDWVERMCPDCPKSGVPQTGRGGGGGGGRGGGGGGAAGGPPAAAAAAVPPDPCRVYAAGGSMRLPGRLNISWADDNTLKVDMDSGTQTRLFHFGVAQAPAGEKTLQGYSIASWDSAAGGGGRGGGGGGRGGGGGGAPASRWSSLTVVTTNMKGGYLLSSRSAYSDNATLTEYFNQSSNDFGVDHLTVIAVLNDGGRTITTSSTFKKEPNASKFSPTGCVVVK